MVEKTTMVFQTRVRSLDVYLVVYLLCFMEFVAPAGNVGCLFNPGVCESEEGCFDDNAFGKCQNQFDVEMDLYRHSLNSDAMQLLQKELAHLFDGGYRWEDDYTQCVVQNILYTKRHGIVYDPGLCSRITLLTLPEAPPEVISDLQNTKPEELANIKFTPSQGNNENVIYASESFAPPLAATDEETKNSDTPTKEDLNMKKRDSKKDSVEDSPEDSQEDKDALFRKLLDVASDTEKLLENEDEFEELPRNNRLRLMDDFTRALERNHPIFSDDKRESRFYTTTVKDNNDANRNFLEPFQKADYNMLLSFMSTRDTHKTYGVPLKEGEGEAGYFPDTVPDILDPQFQWNTRYDIPSEEEIYKKYGRNSDEEKGVPSYENSEENNVPTMEDVSLKFQRPMRYDIKKPGDTYFYHDKEDQLPLINRADEENSLEEEDDILNRLMADAQARHMNQIMPGTTKIYTKPPPGYTQMHEDERVKENLRIQYSPDKETKTEAKNSTDAPDIDEKRTVHKLPVSQPEMIEGVAPFMVKMPSNYVPLYEVQRTGEGKIGHYESVDSTHAYLLIKEKGISSNEAEKVVKSLEKLLALPTNTFGDIRVDGSQVTFKVNENVQGINASDVATKAEELAHEIKSASGHTVESAGIGDKVKFEVVNKESDRKLFILTFVLCGAVLGILLVAAVVFVIRRHARSKEKLQNITQPDREASQDYQDLCRQRKASKTSDGSEAIAHSAFSPKKIRSLSQGEGQASSSSHSSTSSWNEEPVTSNMDISTGHMILSYMEDHLKKKDRLDREWEAMCAYEADPCSTAVAIHPQNAKKNRYPNVLPYDHSRVILNELSNVSSSDYINASSITDHDPRNPAYIATQGPLPHTAADFWQLVWEQGSVVMVMLTRLMENGVAMCHRHWPEEGSEVYHIYEVHLVSEHIWCDDYLVRSFYLKNLRTGETRTVTQFHFLSWPDNGVPNSTKALLEFRRKVNKSYRGRSCPIVVHCSDGIGRSGTYILIDMVLNRMAKGAKEIDIAATLEHVRDQRAGMVKTKAQFEFVLMSIAEEVHAILKALSQ